MNWLLAYKQLIRAEELSAWAKVRGDYGLAAMFDACAAVFETRVEQPA